MSNNRLKIRVWDKVFNRCWTDKKIKENAARLLFPDNDNIDNVEIEVISDIHNNARSY